jgi:hypothetical protein
MFRVLPEALERLAKAELTPDRLIEVFKGLALAANAHGSEVVQLNLDYQGATDQVQEGDLIPVISLSLRPATLPGDSKKES